jgi:hypothetical protein
MIIPLRFARLNAGFLKTAGHIPEQPYNSTGILRKKFPGS